MTNVKRLCLFICYLICVVLVNRNIDCFILPGLIGSAYSVGLFTAGLTMTLTLTVGFITFDKMIKETDKK